MPFNHTPFSSFIFSFICSSNTYYEHKMGIYKKPFSFSSYFQNIGESMILTIKNSTLVSIIIVGVALITTRLIVSQNILQPYQIHIGVAIRYIGTIIAIISLIQAIISLNAYKVFERLGKTFSLIFMIGLPVVALLGMSILSTLWTIPFICFFTLHIHSRIPVSHI